MPVKRRCNASNLRVLTSNRTSSAPCSLSFSYWNAGSIKNKATSLYDYVVSSKIDVMAITETWLYSDEKENAVHINEIVPKEYGFKHAPRKDGRVGGGVGLLYHKGVKIVLPKPTRSVCTGITQFEILDCVLNVTSDPRSSIYLVIVYRPPPTRKNKLKLKTFWKEWKRLLTVLAKDHKSFIIVGDLNFHLDVGENQNTIKFMGILDELNLVQLVEGQTHTAGHTLDVIITQPENSFIIKDSINIHDPGISGSSGNVSLTYHSAISFSLNFCKPKPVYKSISYRNIENLNKKAFLDDLSRLNLEDQLRKLTDVDMMVEHFVSNTISLIDCHAPIKTKCFPERSSNWWYTPELTAQKRLKRKLERRWIKTGLEVHRLEYRKQCAMYGKLTYIARIKESKDRITACERDKTKLFKVCRSLIGIPKHQIQIDDCIDDKEAANAFSSFFKHKTEEIRSDLEKEASALSDVLPAFSKLNQMTKCRNIPSLSHFDPVTAEYVEKLILNSNSKSCILDLIPVRFLKLFAPQFASIIVIIINQSLESGYVPASFKNAIVFPSIKEYDSDLTDVSNYRPVSNLPYLAKLLEKVVYAQLEQHLTAHTLLPASQSAYRKTYSTETSLLKVTNDILSALNQGKSTLLVTVDISAAFDTVNHQMLLERYSNLFGLKDMVLSWFASYLSRRTQAVQVGTEVSSVVEMDCGFAQGSTLGGPKYTMFSTPLDELFKLHEVNHQSYADDSNAYISFDMKDPSDTAAAVTQMEHCLSDVKRWMVQNKLKVNYEKTKAVIFHPPRAAIEIEQNMTIKMDNYKISIAQELKSLGVILDSKMKMNKHVNRTTSTAYYHLSKISKVRKQFNRSTTETFVNTFITSRLDYCNSLICSLPNKLLQKLQRVQNSAAKLIMLKKKRDHVTPLLKELHWLPIKYRSEFKILVITWKILHSSAPENIVNLITQYKPLRNLRSSNENFLIRSSIPRNCSGHRAFSNLSPFLWNGIPSAIRKIHSLSEFKSKLKSHFFIEHFGS